MTERVVSKAVRDNAMQLSEVNQSYQKFTAKARLVVLFGVGFMLGIIAMFSFFYHEFDSTSTLRSSVLTIKESPEYIKLGNTTILREHVTANEFSKPKPFMKLKPGPKPKPMPARKKSKDSDDGKSQDSDGELNNKEESLKEKKLKGHNPNAGIWKPDRADGDNKPTVGKNTTAVGKNASDGSNTKDRPKPHGKSKSERVDQTIKLTPEPTMAPTNATSLSTSNSTTHA